MSPSTQTRNRINPSMLCAPDEKESRARYAQHVHGTGYVESAKKAARTEAIQHLAAVDASFSYGCVDWYIYPESNANLAAP